MSPRPGVIVTSRAARSQRGEEVDTGQWFATGFCERGPVGIAEDVLSIDDFTALYGDRTTVSATLYDSLETFFAEGGALAFISRVAGPTPTKGFLNLMDRAGTPLQTLKVEALYTGSYSSRIKVQVTDGTPANSFTIIVLYDDVEVERYSDILNPAAAPAATAVSAFVLVTNLASATAPPANNAAVLAATALSAGDDKNTTATESDWTSALTFFDKGLGTGQVSAPGRTTLAAQQALVSHASLNNRTAYLDFTDSATRTALITAVNLINVYPGAEYAALFASWVVIPGLTPTSTRVAPGSAFAAGLTSRTDFESGTAAHAPAGDQGEAQFAIDVRQPSPSYTGADYDALNDKGVNMTQVIRGRGVQLYGFRSISTDPEWMFLTYNRVRTSLTFRLGNIAQAFVFDTIDGRGQVFAEFEAALAGELEIDYYLDALFGESSEDAYFVDTGEGINTPTTVGLGEIRAGVFIRLSPIAEYVRIDIIKTPITEAVPGGVS